MDIKPPIDLERRPNPKYNKDQILIFKCKNNPTDTNRAAYEIAVPYFETGTPED